MGGREYFTESTENNYRTSSEIFRHKGEMGDIWEKLEGTTLPFGLLDARIEHFSIFYNPKCARSIPNFPALVANKY